jgi:hypothetical protein
LERVTRRAAYLFFFFVKINGLLSLTMVNELPPEGGTNRSNDGRSAASSPLAWVIVLVHLAISAPLAVILGIILDEGYTLQTTGAGVRYAWTQAIRFELQPPLFFTILSVWRSLDHSILFARCFSLLCAALTVSLAFGLARRCLPGVPRWAVAAICAAHPFMIWSAENIRVYAFAVLLSALLLRLFYDGYLVDDGPKWSRWVYLLVALAALYTQYYLGFVLLANGVALVVERRWRPLRAYVFGMAGVGLLFLPMLPVVYRQFFTHTKDVAEHDAATTSVNDFLWIIKGHLLPAESYKSESYRRWLQIIGLPVLAVVLILNRRRPGIWRFRPIWVIALTLLPVFLLLRYRIGYDFFSAKHTAALFFPIVMSFVALVWIAFRRWGVWLWVAVVLTFCVGSLYADYRPLAKPGDWKRTSAYLMANEKPDQPVLMFSATSAVPFGYYYHGPNRLVPLPRAEAFDTFDIERYVLHSEDEIRTGLNNVPGAHERVWLVTDSFCRLQAVDFNCPLLENYINRYYVVESDHEFYGSRVRLLRMRDPKDLPQ